jgi:hypothetical protein
MFVITDYSERGLDVLLPAKIAMKAGAIELQMPGSRGAVGLNMSSHVT